jgi:hypothetical protein
MDRRSLWSASLASFLTASNPLRSAIDPRVESAVKNGFLREEDTGQEIVSTYARRTGAQTSQRAVPSFT